MRAPVSPEPAGFQLEPAAIRPAARSRMARRGVAARETGQTVGPAQVDHPSVTGVIVRHHALDGETAVCDRTQNRRRAVSAPTLSPTASAYGRRTVQPEPPKHQSASSGHDWTPPNFRGDRVISLPILPIPVERGHGGMPVTGQPGRPNRPLPRNRNSAARSVARVFVFGAGAGSPCSCRETRPWIS